jgi:hypothetical protein
MMAKKTRKSNADKRPQRECEEHGKLIVELLQKKEPIHPDLERHLRRSPMLGMMVHHPLVVSPVHQEGCFAYVNYIYEQNKKLAEELRHEGDWHRYVFAHELAYILDVFSKIAKQLSDKEYWTVLGAVYNQSENLWQQKRKLVRLLTADREEREFLMNGRERNHLAKLPSTLTIHRGYQYRNADGWSWTLAPKKAEWFARRFEVLGGKPTVATGKVKKRDVIAYFSGRREQEIVVDPAVVKVTERSVLQAQRNEDS